ncbi:MAG: hypothetical protein EU532_01565 [Promethearchaeota archaeon]|nr:MAG: hypothetical protein EU532_01565 [Candidatus Lokiarchaeota archaeon]
MVNIRWSIGALEDIESISSYISQDYPEQANEIVRGIFFVILKVYITILKKLRYNRKDLISFSFNQNINY